MGHWAIGALALLASMQPIEGAERPADVTFVQQGVAIALSAREQSEVAARVRALVVGCGINSVSSPGIFGGRDLDTEWQETRARSHLHVRFAEPLRTERGGVPISEAAIGFEDPRFIGPELTRHDDEVVGHVKCDGHRVLALMCAPAVRPHLLEGQAANCRVYDRIGEPK